MQTKVGSGLETRGRRRRRDPGAAVTEEEAHAVLIRNLQVIDMFEDMLIKCVAVLRIYGRSWAYIGQATGLTAEGARRKWSEELEVMGVPSRLSAEARAGLVQGLPPASAMFGPLAES